MVTEFVQHDEWYRLVAQNVTDVVVLQDAQHRYLWVSPSIYDVLGWTPDQVIGRDSSEFVSADLQDRIDAQRAAYTTGVAHLDEVQVRCADGTWKWVSSRSTVVVLPDMTRGRVVVVRDVDEAVRARRAAEAADGRFRLIAEHASDVVCLADPERRLIWVSPSVTTALSWDVDEMLGHALSDFAHPDDRTENSQRVNRLYAVSAPADRATIFGRLRTKSGEYRWMSGVTKPLIDDDGRLTGVAAGLRDVTDLVELKAAAEASAELLRAVVDAAGDSIIRFDHHQRIEYVNPEVVRATGWDEAHFIGRRPSELGYPGDAVRLYEEQLAATFEHGEPCRFQFRLEHSDGRTQWYEANMAPVFGADGTVTHVVSSNRDITDQHRTEEALTYRATRDELTGIANRAAIMDELARALASSSRSGRAAAVLMIDLDHFKSVNDSLGHAAGDGLLSAAATRLVSLVRAGDLAGRLGGDEFVVVMRDVADVQDAEQLAQRIVDGFRLPFDAAGTAVQTTASIGIAVAVEGDGTDLLREADTALYAAKQQGRDRFAAFTDHLRAAVARRQELSGQLRPAFERCEFEVWYQPEVDLRSGEVVALEALLRWQRRSGEVDVASRFIDVAEETGMLTELGGWVLHQACREAADWTRRSGIGCPVRVNLSLGQLAQPQLLTVLDEALASSGLDPRALCLEVAASSLVHAEPAAHEHLAAARARGVRLSVDDFGRGSTSLVALRDTPIDLLKLDGDLVQRIAHDDRDRRIVAGVIAFAQHLEVPVAATGVESDEQAAVLRALACTVGQGYHFARPMPAAEVGGFLMAHRTVHSVGAAGI